MSRPLFSIITITYNSEITVERTIKSVLSQSNQDYEYIIVDGASKDSTLDIIREFEPMFKGRMKWKSEPDKGIYNAMNKGIERATGMLICLVNSDDWLEQDALAKVAEAFEISKCDTNALFCGSIVFHYSNDASKRMDVNLKSFRHYAKYYIMSGIRHPATFVPKDVYKRIGLFQFCNQLLGLQTFGGGGLVRDPFLGEGFCEAAGALQKAQSVVVPPAYDVLFTDQVHGADQLQTLEIGAAQLGHHTLVLP